MRFHLMPLLALGSLAIGCAHRPQTVAKVERKSPKIHYYSWKQHLAHEDSARTPASSIPGLEEFIKALRLNPNVFKVPVGHEVVMEHTYDAGDGEPSEPYKDKRVYLRQTKLGYFEYEHGSEEGELDSFNAHDLDSLEEIIADLRASRELKSIKKISATKYELNMKMDHQDFKATCKVTVDLKSSAELFESTCVDAAGKLVSSTKVTSNRPVSLAEYKEKLKNMKVTVYSKVLDCESLGQTDPDVYCNDAVTDDSENDWSFIIK